MSDLVPQSAIDAVLNEHYGGLREYEAEVRQQLAPAFAPIRADALRWAAVWARKEHAAAHADTHPFVMPECAVTPSQLEAWADELEAGVTERLHGTDDTDRLHEAGDSQ